MLITKYKCDRCGKEMQHPERFCDTPDNPDFEEATYCLFTNYELCLSCARELENMYFDFKKQVKNWMKNK